MNINDILYDRLNGCALISMDNTIVFQQAYGYADLANKIENRIDTKFATASAGKVFVAVAILQLIEKGQLHFSDKIGQLLDFDLKNMDSNITIEELLSHTSGIPDYFDESIMTEYEELWRDYPNYKIRSNKDLLPLFIDKPMMYPHGSKFQYNNTGFVVLAMVIESLTKDPFDNYLLQNIFIPCGMTNTGYYELDRLPAKCANGYIWDEFRGEFRTNIYSVDVKGTGAGGAFTTVGDVSRFWTNLISNKLLSKEMTENMLSIHSGNGENEYYGYGILLRKNQDKSVSPYFEGWDPGVSFISLYDSQKCGSITLVSNLGDNVWKLLNELIETLYDQEV